MNCELIKKKIDQLVFEKNELTRAEVSGHIKTCNSCKAYYRESMAANRIIGLIQKEPFLHDPAGLTNNILTVIDEVEQTPKSTKINNNDKIIRLIVPYLKTWITTYNFWKMFSIWKTIK